MYMAKIAKSISIILILRSVNFFVRAFKIKNPHKQKYSDGKNHRYILFTGCAFYERK